MQRERACFPAAEPTPTLMEQARVLALQIQPQVFTSRTAWKRQVQVPRNETKGA